MTPSLTKNLRCLLMTDALGSLVWLMVEIVQRVSL